MEDEIRQIVMSFGVNCSPEDPIPADLLKKHLELFLPIWSRLVSLSEGSMECLKSAVLIPLIKKMENLLNKDSLKNYRSVKTQFFLGKLTERIVSIRLNRHMTENNLHLQKRTFSRNPSP